ncbi:MAG: valine--tRNA ligase [Bogoriella megaspora]|nr:MAG: valine--tRNA ligase [Bogoriella megaspora]
MALNSASHNIPGEKTGPATGQPPSVSQETSSALLDASKKDAVGQQAPGQDGGDKSAGKKVKTEKELEKERQKAEKAKKFAEKQAKKQAQPEQPSKNKEKKPEGKKPEARPKYVEETPLGEKKILKPLDDAERKAYIPGVVESAWYPWWEKQGFFKPDYKQDSLKISEKGAFTIVIPPPNVTGALHCGHAIATAVQDTLIRWSRMKGYTTLYVPGCDHAGIATQTVVEKMLQRREGKSRHDLGRQKFIERVQLWKEDYHNNITRVLKRMGASFDWTREAFTMDENLSVAVMESFVRLHDEGYIYRSNRLVNWCVQLNTALSNLEVDNKELEGRTLLDVPGYERKVEFGVITHFCYPLEEGGGKIEVATTRPETMLGDTGIAVHPDDKRYKHLVGKNAKHPFVDRLLPIIADEYVDPEFGTGAVKLTPAHDPNDFNLGQKHNLAFINILNDNGTMNQHTGKFEGQKRFDARYTVVDELTKLGLYVKKESNPMKIPLCSRSNDVVEPVIRPQWWMKMKELAEPAINAVRDGDIKIRPESAEKMYLRWMENINDWCLSRQLWWGHQIPAYFVELEGEKGDDSDNNLWVTGRTEQEAREKAEKKFPNKKISGLRRDEDVLDTWFSSGLWPFSVHKWPKNTIELEKLFPTSILETGWDIIPFWVSRMVFLSLKLTGQVPFREVYCHSLIRDSEGRKMSKSLGNVIDPVDIMDSISLDDLHAKLLTGNLDPKEVKNATNYQKKTFPQGIPECGADALRFSLVKYTTGGGDINLDVKVIEADRRFCNKIYQATKYVLGKLEPGWQPQAAPKKTGKESLPERWILSKYNTAVEDIDHALQTRYFSRAAGLLYSYFYDCLCDVYIENSKVIISDGTPSERTSAVETLYTTLEGGLKLLSPFMPFLSEELWQRLPRRHGDTTESITIASFPTHDPEMDDFQSEAAYDLILGCSKGIRSLMSEYSIKDEGEAFVQALDSASYSTAREQVSSIRALAGKGMSSISILSPEQSPPTGCAVFAVSASAAVFLKVEGRVDPEKEIEKAQTKMKQASEGAAKQKKMLEGEDFRAKGSDAVLKIEEQKLKDLETECRSFERSIAQFQEMRLKG